MRRALCAHELDNPRLPRKTAVELTPKVSVPQTDSGKDSEPLAKKKERLIETKLSHRHTKNEDHTGQKAKQERGPKEKKCRKGPGGRHICLNTLSKVRNEKTPVKTDRSPRKLGGHTRS